MEQFLAIFWSYILISAPYLLVGFLIAGILSQLITKEVMARQLGGRKLSHVFKAAVLGVPLPLCSCGVIPAVVMLRKNGASNGASSSFLISTPESGIDSIALTYALLGLPMAIIRPFASFASAFIAGTLQFLFNEYDLDENEVEIGAVLEKESCCVNDEPVKNNKIKDFIKNSLSYGFGNLSDDIAFYLIIGLFVGAGIEFFIPISVMENFNGVWGRFAMVIVGIPLYVCAASSTPVAASFIMKGISPGTALIFMLTGPATNITNILVLQRFIGKRGVIINLFSIISVALIFSYIIDYFFVSAFSNVKMDEAHFHTLSNSCIYQVSAYILVFMIIKGIVKNKIIPLIKNRADKGSCCS